MSEEVERTAGRRASDHVEPVAVVETTYLRKAAGWTLMVLVPLAFAAGLWAMDTNKDIEALKESQFTDKEATELVGALNLLRQEITYLRTAMNRIEANQ